MGEVEYVLEDEGRVVRSFRAPDAEISGTKPVNHLIGELKRGWAEEYSQEVEEVVADYLHENDLPKGYDIVLNVRESENQGRGFATTLAGP